MLPIAHWPVKVQGIGEDMPSNMLSFINFEPLEFYWTYFLALQTTTPKIPPMRLMSLNHEPKNEMMCFELELWALMRLYRHEFWTMGFGIILWIWTFLGFKRNFPKIHDSVNMVQVANDMKSCGVKNLSSTMWYLNERANGPCFLLCEQKRNYYRAVPWYCTCSKYHHFVSQICYWMFTLWT